LAIVGSGGAGLLAAITWIAFTGHEFGHFVVYFIPIGFAAWYGSRAAGTVLTARLMVQAHGGSIEAESPTGVRTRLDVKVPAECPAPAR
jgi:hypothetical protein